MILSASLRRRPPLVLLVCIQAMGLVAVWCGMPWYGLSIAFVPLYAHVRTSNYRIMIMLYAALSLGSAYIFQQDIIALRAWKSIQQTAVLVRAQVEEIVPCATKSGYQFKVYLKLLDAPLVERAVGRSIVVFVRSFPRCQVADEITTYVSVGTLKDELPRYGAVATFFMQRLPIVSYTKPLFSWKRQISILRYQLMRSMQQKLSKPVAYLVAILFTGACSASSSTMTEVRSYCSRWGVSHYLARSGLHVALLCCMWYYLLTLCGCPLVWRYACMLAALAVFALLTYPSVSFWRAGIFLAVRQASLLAGYHMTSRTAIVVTVIILLCVSPAALFAADFQLTVGLAVMVLLTSSSLQKLDKQKFTL